MLNAQQQVSGHEGGRDASLSLNAMQSDRSAAASMDRQVAVGVTWQGLFDARPADILGFALRSNPVNSRVAERIGLSVALHGDAVPVGELLRACMPRPWISVQPNVQHVRHPGGFGASEKALVPRSRPTVDSRARLPPPTT